MYAPNVGTHVHVNCTATSILKTHLCYCHDVGRHKTYLVCTHSVKKGVFVNSSINHLQDHLQETCNMAM